MNDWETLKTFEDWKATLEELLDEARRTSSAHDDAARLTLCSRLRAFVQHSRPNTPEILELDAIAIDAAKALSQSVATDAVDRIESRTAELLLLSKRLRTVSEKASAGAAVLRLEKARAAADAIIGVRRALEDLDTLLTDRTAPELSERIREVVRSLAALLGALEPAA